MNLDEYILHNNSNFCVYTSLCSMLSYYNVWWNQSIFNENDFASEVDCSPGIYCGGEISSELADALDFIGYPTSSSPVDNSAIPAYCQHFIDTYYNNSVRSGEYSINFCVNANGGINDLIAKLDEGHPVMLCIYDAYIGHAVTLFGHDGNTLFAHSGYSESENDRIIELDGMGYFNYFFYLDVDLPHECSSFYYDGCPCLHWASHPHRASHLFSEKNDTHVEYCGNSETDFSHDPLISFIESDEDTHVYSCHCGIRNIGHHTDLSPEVLDIGYQHRLACHQCGYEWVGEHFAYFYRINSQGLFDTWCYCGYSMFVLDYEPVGLINSSPCGDEWWGGLQ